MSQTEYIRNLLKKYGMDECKSLAVQLDPGYQVKCINNCERVYQQLYQSMIGALMHSAITQYRSSP